MRKTKTLYILVLILCACITAQAQSRKQKGKPKTEPVKVEEKSEAEELYDEMLVSTAQLMIIDSTVIGKADFIDKIPLSSESGQIIPYNAFWNTTGQPSSYVYLNELGSHIIYSEADKQGRYQLFMADKLGGEWANKRAISDFNGELEDANHPFMMPDGVTLYFSAKSKDNLGGYDIYVTRYDADSARFYKPENIGLPYNSSANDFYCVIDEFNDLGWLITDRRQPDGKVCIYTFVPPASRTTYNAESMNEQKLRSLADIKQIKDTWTNNTERQKALARVKALVKHKASQGAPQLSFIVNDNTIYTKPEDFKLAVNRERFTKLCEMKRQLSSLEKELDANRKKYTYGTNEMKQKLGKAIITQEKRVERLVDDIKRQEKELRNAENITLNKK